MSALNSPILQEYVMQTKETRLNAHRKMGSYLTNENGSETPDFIGWRQTPEGGSSNSFYSMKENGGSDGTLTRSLRRDRPERNEE